MSSTSLRANLLSLISLASIISLICLTSIPPSSIPSTTAKFNFVPRNPQAPNQAPHHFGASHGKATNTIHPEHTIDETIDVVDSNNNVIKQIKRKDMLEQNFNPRRSYAIITNKEGKIYVQRRSKIKDVNPGFLDPAPGGVLVANETYELSAMREIEEEMGMKNVALVPVGDFKYSVEEWTVFGRIFTGRYDGPLTLQEDEVAEVALMSIAEIYDAFHSGEDVTPDGMKALEHYLDWWFTLYS